MRQMGSVISQRPVRCAQPALGFRQVAAPVEPPHLFPSSVREGRGERGFAFIITAAFAGDEPGRADPSRREFAGAAFDPKYRATSLKLAAIAIAFSRRQGHDETAAFGKPVEPGIGWPCDSGADIDDVCRRELDLGAVALRDADIALAA